MVTILILILIRIALLFERKNKERVVSVVGVNTTGRSIVIGEELATYDKVIVLNMLENDEERYKKRVMRMKRRRSRRKRKNERLHWESCCCH